MIQLAPSMADLVKLYAIHHPSLDEGSVKLYQYAVKSLERHCDYIPHASDLSDDLLLPWLGRRLRERSPKTVRRERSDLLTLWRFAYKKGMTANPPIDFPTVKVPRKNPNSWTVEEYQTIAASCAAMRGEMRGTGIPKSRWWSSMTTFLYWVGCRIGAALAVRWEDVNLQRRTVRLIAEEAKTDTEQVLTLHQQTVDAIASMRSSMPTVWPFPYGHRHIWDQYKSILRRAGLPADRSHMFQKTRRTTYTLCVKYGSKEVASRQLGHKTDMSRFYLDTSQLDDVQASDILPSI